MNKRIQELVKQADIEFDVSSDNYGVDTATVIPYDLEKFAELIIRECARVARATPAPDFHEHLKQQLGHTWDMAASEAGREIVKHFGVES